MTLLKTENLGYSAGEKCILKNINISVPQKGITAILGINGSGKSTLISLLGGHLQPESGIIWFNNSKLIGPDYKLIPGHSDIAIVRQDMKLVPYATVFENLSHVLRNLNEEGQKAKISELAELLGFTPLLYKTLKYLSGGEQQRVSIAAALASSPRLLLMDEPFSQTDGRLKFELKKHLSKIAAELDISILFVTHDAQEALAMAQHIFVLHEGEIKEEGIPQTLYYAPKSVLTAELTGICNWLPVTMKKKGKNLVFVEDRYLLRPDKLRIFTSDMPGRITARVINSEFSGIYSLVYLQFNAADIQLIAVSFSGEFVPGQEVYIEY